MKRVSPVTVSNQLKASIDSEVKSELNATKISISPRDIPGLNESVQVDKIDSPKVTLNEQEPEHKKMEIPLTLLEKKRLQWDQEKSEVLETLLNEAVFISLLCCYRRKFDVTESYDCF